MKTASTSKPAAMIGPEWHTVRTALTIAVYFLGFFAILPAFLWALGGQFDRLFAWPSLPRVWNNIGIALLILGSAGLTWSMGVLSIKGRGLPITHLGPEKLVTHGPYRYVRNPIYVAYTATLAGAGLLWGSTGRGVAAPVLLWAGCLIYSLGFEEPRLARRLGGSYREYRATVPLVPFTSLSGPARRSAEALWAVARPGVERVANHVVLFRFGPTVWVTYGALLALGAAMAAAVIGSLLVAGGASPSIANGYLAALAISSVVCGRLVWLAYQGRDLLREPLHVLRSVGFVSWGAILAALALPLAFSRFVPGNALWLLDRTLPGLLVVEAVGRLGCLTYGCCYGRASPHGIRWVHPDAKLIRQDPDFAGQRRVPTQLIASGWALLSLALLVLATAAPIPAGTVAGLTLLLYSFGRFGGDCLRDEPRFGIWRLTAGQIGSLIAASLGTLILFNSSGPPAWPVPAWSLKPVYVLSLWPAVVVSGAVVFLGCALHWRKVGRW